VQVEACTRRDPSERAALPFGTVDKHIAHL